MAAHLLLVGATQADHPHSAIPVRENHAVAIPVDAVEGQVADFAILDTAIYKDFRSLKVDLSGNGERQAMLGFVRGVLGGVEFDVHGNYVHPLIVRDNRIMGVHKNKFDGGFYSRRFRFHNRDVFSFYALAIRFAAVSFFA
jgi:hypothetical protein